MFGGLSLALYHYFLINVLRWRREQFGCLDRRHGCPYAWFAVPEPTAWMSVLLSIRYGAIARRANDMDLLLVYTFARGSEKGNFIWFGWAPLSYLMEF